MTQNTACLPFSSHISSPGCSALFTAELVLSSFSPIANIPCARQPQPDFCKCGDLQLEQRDAAIILRLAKLINSFRHRCKRRGRPLRAVAAIGRIEAKALTP